MKAAVFIAPGQIEVQETAKPEIDGENQAIIRVVRASVCGSDLWWYRGIPNEKPIRWLVMRQSGLLNRRAQTSARLKRATL